MKYEIIKKEKIDYATIHNKKVFIGIPLHNIEWKKLKKTLETISNSEQNIFVYLFKDKSEKQISLFEKEIREILRCTDCEFEIDESTTINIAQARQKILDVFLEDYYDYYLSLDDDTLVKKNAIEKAVYILENCSEYDYISGDYLQMKSTLYPFFGDLYEHKIRKAHQLDFGGMFSMYSRKAIVDSNAFYHPDCSPREDSFFQANLMNCGFIGCKTRLNFSHIRHKRSKTESFAFGSDDWIKSCFLLKRKFPNLISKITKDGKMFMINKFKIKDTKYILDDKFKNELINIKWNG